MPGGAPVLVAFDFDGTLTRVDTSVPFLRHALGPRATLSAGLRTLPGLPGAVREAAEGARTGGDGLGRGGAGRLWGRLEARVHARLLETGLAGRSRAWLADVGRRFAAEALPALLRPDALRRVEAHRRRGHRVALVSASLEVYLAPWGAPRGIDPVVGTRLAFDDDDRCTGRLEGRPCWGAEKIRRLEAAVGPLPGWTLVAYGDSAGDGDLLDAADHPVLVRPGSPFPAAPL